MANYIINDNGENEITVFDDKQEIFTHKTYHIYHDSDRRKYPYSEFYQRVFYEDKNNMITSITISEVNPRTNEMYFVYGDEKNSSTSVFNANEYQKVTIKRFAYATDEDNNPFYEETEDVYYIRKRINDRLMEGIKIRKNNLENQLEDKFKRINTIKKNIDRKRKVTAVTHDIIDNYFENEGAFSDEVLGTITSRELKKEIEDHQEEIKDEVSRKWSITDNIRKISNTATTTGILGSSIATAISSVKSNEFTMGPIILGIGTVFITHHLLKNIRMTLVDTKIGQIEREYHKENYDYVTGRRR